MSDDTRATDEAALTDLESVLADTEELIGGTSPEQGDAPTPCPDMNVSQLVDHVLGWSATYAARAMGVERNDDPESHTALPDAAKEFRSYADAILAAYRSEDVSEEAVPVGVLLMDYQAHGWDLARATGQDVPYGDREASRALETGRGMLKPEYRGPDKDFGDEVPVKDSASLITQLAGFLGRDPDWAPPA